MASPAAALAAHVAAAVLLAASLPGAQAPAPATLIRDVAPSNGVLVVQSNGVVVTWGRSASGGIPAPTPVDLPGPALRVAVAGSLLGSFTGYAVLEDGTIAAWGANNEGQLGNGAMGASRALGISPKPWLTPVKVTGLTDVADIDAGNTHAIALRRDGTVWAWGSRDDGALGGGQVIPAGGLRVLSALAPVPVPGLADITQIASGPRHSLALTRDGHVWSWGANNAGELGLGTRATGWTPAEVPGLDRVVAIAAGSTGTNGVSGALRDDGTVWLWGTSASAMMGNGQGATAPDDPGGRGLAPAQVPELTGVRQLSIGSGHVAALLGDGTLRMWGHNGYGELGHPTTTSYATRPEKVTALTNVAAVYLGSMRSYAVTTDGRFWVWGFGNFETRGILAKNLRVPTPLELP